MERQRLVEWLTETRRVLAFCGAGVSAESGIPTFRGSGGLWEGHDLEQVATREGFAADPALVWRFYAARMRRLPDVRPNPAHLVLAEMERAYPACLTVTQNVDDLHERAGSRALVKMHGSLLQTRCTGCGSVRAVVPGELNPDAALPRCDCGALLRPNVVWFGEWLDPSHLRRIDRFLRDATRAERPVLLVLGTSGAVSGGYGMLERSIAHGFRVVEVNPEETLLTGLADLSLREPVGALLGEVWPAVRDRLQSRDEQS